MITCTRILCHDYVHAHYVSLLRACASCVVNTRIRITCSDRVYVSVRIMCRVRVYVCVRVLSVRVYLPAAAAAAAAAATAGSAGMGAGANSLWGLGVCGV
jgi:hypothetical protein